MQIDRESIDEIDRQSENSLRRLNELLQRTEALPTLYKQQLTEALEDHYRTLGQMQVVVEELRQQNEELVTTRQALEAERRRYQELAERQQAEAALRQQTEWERLIGAMAQRIRQSLNLKEILNTAVAEVRQFLQADRVVIYRLSSSGDGIVVAESVDAAWSSLLGITIATPLFRECVALYRQGTALVINDTQQEVFPAAINEFLQQQQVKASLTVPILHDGNQYSGLLATYQCCEPRHWQPLEVELLKQLATQVSIAIQQSELYQQVQQLNTNLEYEVQERTAQLQKSLEFEAMLKRISDNVRDSLDESQILQVAVRELAVVLKIDGCNTSLYDAHYTTATISYEYTTGVPFTHGHVVQIVEFLEWYGQLLQGQYFQFCELVPSFRGSVAMLACPIFDDQGVLGDLWLFKQRDDAFNELEIRLVQQVANQCAIAIRQARFYQAAQAQVEELQKLSRLKDEFLSTVSHELRTPVANMKMAIQMLALILNRDQPLLAELAKPAAEQSQVARYFQILHNECEREISLINDLLDLQSLYAGVQPLVLSSIQLQDWLPQIVEPFQEQARNRQLSLQIDIFPEVPSFICDPASLERILVELLQNACKYTPPGEKIVVRVDTQSGMMQLSVSNSGVEIPASELPRIFDKFYRVPSTDTWKQGGTGLGLALVQQLVAHLQGTIRVESSVGQTSFTLELPIDNTV